MLLGRYEFGKDDYSLNIINLPMMEEETVDMDTEDEGTIDNGSTTNKNSKQTLFD